MRKTDFHSHVIKMEESTVQKHKISESKVKKNEDVHIKGLSKRIEKYKAELTNELKHNVLLIGDSKVRHIENEMTNNTHISAFWRSGSTLDNPVLKRHMNRHLYRFNKPVIILWFNTCYLTRVTDKIRKYIQITANANIINYIINEYTAFKQQMILAKSTAKIIFLECPWYSITEWNRVKGHPNTAIFQESQIQLEGIIVELNKRIKQLNSPYNPPQLAQDMILSIKKKKIIGKLRKLTIQC